MKDYRQQENGFMRHNQNRRSRGRNNNNRKGPNPLTRSYESNGPDVKVRGTAMHVAEKYMSLARDAQSSGDIVAAENYLQHAEHYNRIVMTAQAQFQQAQQPQSRDGEDNYDDSQNNGRGPRDRFDYNGDGGRDDDEGDRFDSTEEEQSRSFQPQARQSQPRQDDRGPRGPRGDRQAQSNDRGDRGDRSQDRGPDRNQDRGGDRQQDQRRDGGDRYDRRPERAARDEGSDNGRRDESEDRGEADVERAAAQPSTGAMPSEAPQQDAAGDAEAPPVRRRRGRPPRAESAPAPAEGSTPDTTPDGTAALAAFPE